jgi:hypothetical protein
MLKLIAVGDIHFKIRNDIDKEWQIKRYEAFVDTLVAECKRQDAVLALLGDQFDSIDPGKEELRLFLYLLGEADRAGLTTLLVSGNHETVAPGISYLDFLELYNFNNIVYRNNYYIGGVAFTLLNHDSLRTDLAPAPEDFNVLLTHARRTVNQFIREEIDVAEMIAPFDLIVAGDIHEPIHDGNFWYTGSPLNKDFQPNPSATWLEIDIDPVNRRYAAKHVSLDGPLLVKVKAHAADWPLQLKEPHYYHVELSGEAAELRPITAIGRMKLTKIPDLAQALILAEAADQQEAVGEAVAKSLEEELAQHLTALDYPTQEVAEMLTVLREEAA